MEAQEHLRKHVVHMRLSWGQQPLGLIDSNRDMTTRLIGLLPNLKTLHLLPGHLYFSHTSLTQISALHLCMPFRDRATVSDFEGLFRHNPHLSNLVITATQSWASDDHLSVPQAGSDDIRLMSLVAHMSIYSTVCCANTMKNLLRAPKTLVSLHYHYNGDAAPNRNAIMPTNFPYNLKYHEASLEELVVHAHPHQHIPLQHPIGRVMQTLEHFTALKRLGLPAWWMVHPATDEAKLYTEGDTNTRKLVEMLPSKLEILQIQSSELHFVCGRQARITHCSWVESVTAQCARFLAWLREIADYKASHIPALKKVTVWSSIARLPEEEEMNRKSGVSQAFSDVDVELDFTVCRPESTALFGINMRF